MEYIRKHAVRLLRLREQHTPPRSVIIIVVSLQLMHFLIHTSQWKVNHYLSLSLLFYLVIAPRHTGDLSKWTKISKNFEII